MSGTNISFESDVKALNRFIWKHSTLKVHIIVAPVNVKIISIVPLINFDYQLEIDRATNSVFNNSLLMASLLATVVIVTSRLYCVCLISMKIVS